MESHYSTFIREIKVFVNVFKDLNLLKIIAERFTVNRIKCGLIWNIKEKALTT